MAASEIVGAVRADARYVASRARDEDNHRLRSAVGTATATAHAVRDAAETEAAVLAVEQALEPDRVTITATPPPPDATRVEEVVAAAVASVVVEVEAPEATRPMVDATQVLRETAARRAAAHQAHLDRIAQLEQEATDASNAAAAQAAAALEAEATAAANAMLDAARAEQGVGGVEALMLAARAAQEAADAELARRFANGEVDENGDEVRAPLPQAAPMRLIGSDSEEEVAVEQPPPASPPRREPAPPPRSPARAEDEQELVLDGDAEAAVAPAEAPARAGDANATDDNDVDAPRYVYYFDEDYGFKRARVPADRAAERIAELTVHDARVGVTPVIRGYLDEVGRREEGPHIESVCLIARAHNRRGVQVYTYRHIVELLEYSHAVQGAAYEVETSTPYIAFYTTGDKKGYPYLTMGDPDDRYQHELVEGCTISEIRMFNRMSKVADLCMCWDMMRALSDSLLCHFPVGDPRRAALQPPADVFSRMRLVIADNLVSRARSDSVRHELVEWLEAVMLLRYTDRDFENEVLESESPNRFPHVESLNRNGTLHNDAGTGVYFNVFTWFRTIAPPNTVLSEFCALSIDDVLGYVHADFSHINEVANAAQAMVQVSTCMTRSPDPEQINRVVISVRELMAAPDGERPTSLEALTTVASSQYRTITGSRRSYLTQAENPVGNVLTYLDAIAWDTTNDFHDPPELLPVTYMSMDTSVLPEHMRAPGAQRARPPVVGVDTEGVDERADCAARPSNSVHLVPALGMCTTTATTAGGESHIVPIEASEIRDRVRDYLNRLMEHVDDQSAEDASAAYDMDIQFWGRRQLIYRQSRDAFVYILDRVPQAVPEGRTVDDVVGDARVALMYKIVRPLFDDSDEVIVETDEQKIARFEAADPTVRNLSLPMLNRLDAILRHRLGGEAGDPPALPTERYADVEAQPVDPTDAKMNEGRTLGALLSDRTALDELEAISAFVEQRFAYPTKSPYDIHIKYANAMGSVASERGDGVIFPPERVDCRCDELRFESMMFRPSEEAAYGRGDTGNPWSTWVDISDLMPPTPGLAELTPAGRAVINTVGEFCDVLNYANDLTDVPWERLVSMRNLARAVYSCLNWLPFSSYPTRLVREITGCVIDDMTRNWERYFDTQARSTMWFRRYGAREVARRLRYLMRRSDDPAGTRCYTQDEYVNMSRGSYRAYETNMEGLREDPLVIPNEWVLGVMETVLECMTGEHGNGDLGRVARLGMHMHFLDDAYYHIRTAIGMSNPDVGPYNPAATQFGGSRGHRTLPGLAALPEAHTNMCAYLVWLRGPGAISSDSTPEGRLKADLLTITGLLTTLSQAWTSYDNIMVKFVYGIASEYGHEGMEAGMLSGFANTAFPTCHTFSCATCVPPRFTIPLEICPNIPTATSTSIMQTGESIVARSFANNLRAMPSEWAYDRRTGRAVHSSNYYTRAFVGGARMVDNAFLRFSSVYAHEQLAIRDPVAFPQLRPPPRDEHVRAGEHPRGIAVQFNTERRTLARLLRRIDTPLNIAMTTSAQLVRICESMSDEPQPDAQAGVIRALLGVATSTMTYAAHRLREVLHPAIRLADDACALISLDIPVHRYAPWVVLTDEDLEVPAGGLRPDVTIGLLQDRLKVIVTDTAVVAGVMENHLVRMHAVLDRCRTVMWRVAARHRELNIQPAEVTAISRTASVTLHKLTAEVRDSRTNIGAYVGNDVIFRRVFAIAPDTSDRFQGEGYQDARSLASLGSIGWGSAPGVEVVLPVEDPPALPPTTGALSPPEDSPHERPVPLTEGAAHAAVFARIVGELRAGALRPPNATEGVETALSFWPGTPPRPENSRSADASFEGEGELDEEKEELMTYGGGGVDGDLSGGGGEEGLMPSGGDDVPSDGGAEEEEERGDEESDGSEPEKGMGAWGGSDRRFNPLPMYYVADVHGAVRGVPGASLGGVREALRARDAAVSGRVFVTRWRQ